MQSNNKLTYIKINPQDLKYKWNNIKNKQQVVKFYSHKNGKYICFSNFYKHEPFEFIIPEWCGKFANTKVSVEFSEKAIMLCKASLFSDSDIFNKIIQTNIPIETKKLGRKSKFDQKIWDENICNIAKTVIYQKFFSIPEFKEILIGTKDLLIAETAPRDKIWGIGMGKNNENSDYPEKWKGYNILGWSLMEARSILK